MQKILALSARHVNDANTRWRDNGASNWNGGAMHASSDYGFGAVDARAAVRLAETWMARSTAENESSYSARSTDIAKTINAGQTIVSTLAMNSGLQVEHVEIDLDTTFTRLGDLIVKLVSPCGTESILLNRQGKVPEGMPQTSDSDRGSAQTGTLKYTFMTTHDLGEKSGGNWTLQVTDAINGDPVTLNNWGLRLYGSKASTDDTYVFTDEYKNALAINASRGLLNDAVNGCEGGRNTINAAAISGDTSINLITGQASLGGTALTIHNPVSIQNIVTGDGNDTLVANHNDAIISGGRGQNTLTGGSGKNLFVIQRRDDGLDTLINFDTTRAHSINLVGFGSMRFKDLILTQQGSDVLVALGARQTLLIKNQHVATLGATQHFSFQNTFSAPSAYVDSSNAGLSVLSAMGVVSLVGGSRGISITSSPTGQMLWSLAGKVYSHDNASADRFVIEPQSAKADYGNALRGFKPGVDKIDLSHLGITSFGELTVTKRNRGTINGISTIHGVAVSSAALGVIGTAASLVYLDTLEVSQITESDFIFAQQGTQPIAQPPQLVPPAIASLPFISSFATRIPFFPEDTNPRDVIAPMQPKMTPEFVVDPLIARSPSYSMIDNTQPWRSQSLSSLFRVRQGDSVTYSTSLANSNPVPAWITYDPMLNSLSGTPGADTTGVMHIQVTATNQDGMSVKAMMQLHIQPKVLTVDSFQTLEIPDTQVAINAPNAFSAIKATGGSHVLLQSGSMSSAILQGDGANTVTVTGSMNKLTVGDGSNSIKLAGSSATVVAGNGANTISSTDSSAKLTLGNGDNTVAGTFQKLTVGNGDNKISSSGAIAQISLGDGHDIVAISGDISTVKVGHGRYDLDFSGSLGRLAFSSDVAADHLWFSHKDADLHVAVVGCTETVMLKDWYASAPHRVSSIVAGDGKTLSNYNVDKLVQAMASFTPPGAGATSFTPDQQQALKPLLAANWH